MATQPQQPVAPLQVPPAAYMPALEEGLLLLFNLWPAMRLAVENDFAEDGQSAVYASDMVDDTLWVLNNNNNVDIDDIADFLTQRFSEIYDGNLEDDSDLEMGRLIMVFFKECQVGNYSRVESLRRQFGPARPILFRLEPRTSTQ